MEHTAYASRPLRWPDTGIPLPSAREAWWKRVPIIGGCIAGYLSIRREWSVARTFHDQVRQRPRADPRIWGDDPARQRVAICLAQAIQKAGRWPNAHFLPDDPIDILWWEHDGGLEPIEVHFELEESLGFKTTPEAFYAMDTMTFGQAVDHMMGLVQRKS